jgi:hypothetical protein
MKFNVTGADKDTGESIEMTIEAADESAAQDVAHRKGIMVSRVAPAALAARPPIAHAVPVSQPLEQGHFRGAPVVNIAPPRRGNSLGIAALVLGILAFLICWIPVVNLLGVPLSALGLLLGLIGLLVAFTRKGASIGFPIAGTAVCALALFIAISMTGAFVGGLKKATDEIVKDAERRNATNQTTAAPVTPKPTAPETPKPDVTPKATADTKPAVPPSVVTPPPAPKKPEVEWAAAETPVKQGDVQIQVKGVRVGKVPLKERIGDSSGESKDVLLMIDLEVANLGETKKLDYRSWGGRASSFGTRTALTDNFDNKYKVVNFGFSSEVVGSVQSESVYPGKSIRDVLVFEEPIGKVEYLNLELPAAQFGGEGMLRIRIPASMIQR